MLKFVIEKLRGSETDDDVQVVLAVDEAMELLVSTGFRKPVSQLGMTDVEDVIMVLLEYHLFVKVKAEIDQFVDGLKTLGFLGCLRKNPSMWESFFLPPKVTLTPGVIKSLFTVIYSDRGTHMRMEEEQAYVFFVDFLDECYYEEIGCTLKDVLIFFSGADALPPLGFDSTPTVCFSHAIAKLPTASTCGVHLTIPTCHKSYADFKDSMILGIHGNDGFGGI